MPFNNPRPRRSPTVVASLPESVARAMLLAAAGGLAGRTLRVHEGVVATSPVRAAMLTPMIHSAIRGAAHVIPPDLLGYPAVATAGVVLGICTRFRSDPKPDAPPSYPVAAVLGAMVGLALQAAFAARQPEMVAKRLAFGCLLSLGQYACLTLNASDTYRLYRGSERTAWDHALSRLTQAAPLLAACAML